MCPIYRRMALDYKFTYEIEIELDVPPICSPIICLVIPPSAEPIQSLRAPSIGTFNCVQKQIYDDGFYRYKWQEVC